MSKFLSSQWADELVAAFASSGEPLEGIRLKLQQVVTGGPDGDVSYWTVFDDGSVSAGIGTTDEPDVTLTLDYPTAIELARGELIAQAAFMQGKLKVTGNMGSLLQNQAAVAALGNVMSTLSTDY